MNHEPWCLRTNAPSTVCKDCWRNRDTLILLPWKKRISDCFTATHSPPERPVILSDFLCVRFHPNGVLSVSFASTLLIPSYLVSQNWPVYSAMHLSIASCIKSQASPLSSKLLRVSKWFKVICRYCCGQLQLIIWYLKPMHIRSYSLSILLLFNLIIDECANFSKICFVDDVEYITWGLNNSSTKIGEYIAFTTSCNTLRAFSSCTDCAWSLWLRI